MASTTAQECAPLRRSNVCCSHVLATKYLTLMTECVTQGYGSHKIGPAFLQEIGRVGQNPYLLYGRSCRRLNRSDPNRHF